MARSEPKGPAAAVRRAGDKAKAPAAPPPPPSPSDAPAERSMIELVNAAAQAAERASERARAASLHGLALRLAELKAFVLRLEHDANGEVAALLDALSKRI